MAKVPEEAAGSRRKWLPIAALLLLSFLWAADWLRADLLPGSTAGLKLNSLLSQAALLGAFSILCMIAGMLLRQGWPARPQTSSAVLVGIGLFVIPAVLALLSKKSLDCPTQVALFSLTPLFAVIFEPHFSPASEEIQAPRGAFLAAMVAVAGTFLVFSVEIPHSFATALALFGFIGAAASTAAANCFGVQTVLRSKSVPAFAAVAAASAACLMALLAGVVHQNEASAMPVYLWTLPRLLALALLFWLMRHMGAVQMTTRFLIAPLAANLIGIVFLRPLLQIQAWIGLLLIAAASGWLLLAPAAIDESAATTLQLK